MEGGGVPLYLAYAAGLVSFASACVLPIVPAFGVLIAGLTMTASETDVRSRDTATALRYSVLFLVGFGLVFVLTGTTATAVGNMFRDGLPLFEGAGAIAVGAFGVVLLAAFGFGRRAAPVSGPTRRLLFGMGAALAGAGFAAAWTPCIGPVLAEILLYGAFPETLLEGVLLLAVYMIGLGTPFLLVGIAAGALISRSERRDRVRAGLGSGLGIVLLVFCVLLLTGRFAGFTAYLSGFGPLIEFGL